MNRLTPGRARIAVLLYGLSLFFRIYGYRFERMHNRINYRSFFDAFFRSHRSVWATLLTPSELVSALGLTPLVMESVGGITGTLGLTRNFLKHTVEIGVPSSLCTFHRAHLSMVLKNGFYPPGCVFAVSALCDGNLRSLQEISEYYPTPFFFVDVPEPDAPGGEVFLKNQLEEVYHQLAHLFRVKHPLERIERTVEIAEETRVWIEKVNELRQTRYIPDVKPMSMAWHLLNQTAQLGSPRGLSFYKTLYQDLSRYGRNFPKDKLKFLLMHLPPTYDHPVVETISGRGGLIVIEEFNTLKWSPMDPKDPFGSIARKILSIHLLGGPMRRIDHINSLARDYHVDGIINFAHWGCRQSSGSLEVMKERIQKPLLSVDTDLVDSESSSAGQIKTRVESFIEMLKAQYR